MSAAKLWKEALKSFGRVIDLDKESLAQILGEYIKEVWEKLPPQRGLIEQDVTIPFDLAFMIYKRLQENKKGRPPTPLSERLDIDHCIRQGREHKAQLIAKGMPRGEAHEKVVNAIRKELNEHYNIKRKPDTLRNQLYRSK